MVVTIVLVVKKKQSPEKEKEKARIKAGNEMWIPKVPWPAFFIFLSKNAHQQIFDNFVNINNIIKSHCPSIKDSTTTMLFVLRGWCNVGSCVFLGLNNSTIEGTG